MLTNQRLGSITGEQGELFACNYLKKGGWVILKRNFQLKIGEIDIIAKDPKGVLVFVEVKTMRAVSFQGLLPENNLSYAKLIKMKRIAELFANANPQLVHNDLGWRIDLISLVLPGNLIYTKYNKSVIVNYYENL
jgi:putative endonuclease